MSKSRCHRVGLARHHSEFSMLLSRRRPPRFDQLEYCSESCLQEHTHDLLTEKWRLLQLESRGGVRRPRLGAILLERAFITPDQLDAAINLQRQSRQGRLGECLLRLGFIEEHQITMALSRQYGLPMIRLYNAAAGTDAAKLIPGAVAKSSNLVPVGYDDDQTALRIAVSGPVDFKSQEAIRRMLHRGVTTYISDESAIQAQLERLYSPEDLDLSSFPTYSSLNELLDLGKSIISSAVDQRAMNIQFELMSEYLWARLDYEGAIHHQFYRHQPASAIPRGEPMSGDSWSYPGPTVQ